MRLNIVEDGMTVEINSKTREECFILQFIQSLHDLVLFKICKSLNPSFLL